VSKSARFGPLGSLVSKQSNVSDMKQSCRGFWGFCHSRSGHPPLRTMVHKGTPKISQPRMVIFYTRDATDIQAQGSKVKFTALRNDVENLLNSQLPGRGLLDFAQIRYSLSSCDTRRTTNV